MYGYSLFINFAAVTCGINFQFLIPCKIKDLVKNFSQEAYFNVKTLSPFFPEENLKMDWKYIFTIENKRL